MKSTRFRAPECKTRRRVRSRARPEARAALPSAALAGQDRPIVPGAATLPARAARGPPGPALIRPGRAQACGSRPEGALMGLPAHFPGAAPAPAHGPSRSLGSPATPCRWRGRGPAGPAKGRACRRAPGAGLPHRRNVRRRHASRPAAGRARAGIRPPTRLLPRAARGQASRDPVPFLQSSAALKCRRTSRPSTTSTRRPPTVGRTSISYTVPLPDFVPTVTSPRQHCTAAPRCFFP